MPDCDARARHESVYVIRDGDDGLDPIVHEEHLSTAVQLATDPLFDQCVVPRLDECQHRRAIPWRRLHECHVTQSRKREMQRPRDGCRRQRQDVRLETELLEPLLVPHTEAMLFVDHDQPQLAELDVGTEQSVRTDDDVDLLGGEVRQDGLLLLGRLKATERFHP